ncbi:MAG: T9SS type A sorting domain-containing protein [Bacteroidales bacterium]|nr:T9SS type A sorting domain-containing protein [Bacteroidales bacterium]
MKNLILPLMVFLTLSANAQVFAPIGASWYYGESNSGAAPSNSEYIHYESVKDTIVKEQAVRKIVRKYYRYAGYTSVLEPLFVYNSTDTAYLYNPDKDNFGKLYIFNKHKGDTLTLDVPYGDSYPSMNKESYRIVIDSVSTELFNGFSVNKYQVTGLDNFQFWNNGWYMDYAGGLDWFFPRAAIFPEAGGPLRCYSDPDFSVNFTTKACDYRLISNVSEFEDKSVLLYPNPVNEVFQVSSSKQIVKYEIFDNLGILKIADSKLPANISQLKAGVYVIRMLFQDDTIIYRMIIKE